MWIMIQRKDNKEKYYVSNNIDKLLDIIKSYTSKKIGEYYYKTIDNIEFIIRIAEEVD